MRAGDRRRILVDRGGMRRDGSRDRRALRFRPRAPPVERGEGERDDTREEAEDGFNGNREKSEGESDLPGAGLYDTQSSSPPRHTRRESMRQILYKSSFAGQA